MRVSKAVREYIEDRVTEKLTTKYAPEKERAEYEAKVKDKIMTAAARAARKTFAKIVTDGCAEHDFLEVCENNFPHCGGFNSVYITDRLQASSVHRWKDRMEKERNEITRNIIVQLELGGNKDDLERMLSEI